MKINGSIQSIAALMASLAIVATQADAKPGKGNSDGKGKDHGGKVQSQKAKPDKGKGPDHAGKVKGNSGKVGKVGKNPAAVPFARFQDHERSEIVEYFGRYRTQGEGLPPGLAMNLQRGKPLPPGWQKKLVPGYRIEENEWSRYTVVPSEWFPSLRMEPNTRLYHYGDRVVRVYEPRREVIDVITLPSGR